MSPSDVALVESTLGVRLPAPYRMALEDHGLLGDVDDHLEFVTEAQILIDDNKHFLRQSDDISEYLKPGILGAVGFFLSFGSGKRLRKKMREWHEVWTQGQRFLIGTDGGEESFFIVLSESEPKVYCFEYESQRAYPIAPSIQEWLAEIKRRQLDHNDT